MLFLPSTMVTHINSADIRSLSKLYSLRLDKNCVIKINVLRDEAINTQSLIGFHDTLINLHPDTIMLVDSTRVIENSIHASIRVKFTACSAIYNAVSRTVTDPALLPMLGLPREAGLRRNISRQDLSEEEKHRLYPLFKTEADLQVYVHLHLVLTIDEVTKKVTSYTMNGRVTSVLPVTQPLI